MRTAPEIIVMMPAHTALLTDVFIATLLWPVPVLAARPHSSQQPPRAAPETKPDPAAVPAAP